MQLEAEAFFSKEAMHMQVKPWEDSPLLVLQDPLEAGLEIHLEVHAQVGLLEHRVFQEEDMVVVVEAGIQVGAVEDTAEDRAHPIQTDAAVEAAGHMTQETQLEHLLPPNTQRGTPLCSGLPPARLPLD
jgi:glyceraldehyde-3-phosphate dehydrogenase/erythrose-4-phosphate dehydrogenase